MKIKTVFFLFFLFVVSLPFVSPGDGENVNHWVALLGVFVVSTLILFFTIRRMTKKSGKTWTENREEAKKILDFIERR